MDIRMKVKDDNNIEIPVVWRTEENAVSLLGQEGRLDIARFDFPKVLNNGDTISAEYVLKGK